jgi:hypothetical protein
MAQPHSHHREQYSVSFLSARRPEPIVVVIRVCISTSLSLFCYFYTKILVERHLSLCDWSSKSETERDDTRTRNMAAGMVSCKTVFYHHSSCTVSQLFYSSFLCRTFLLFAFLYIDPFLRKMRGYREEKRRGRARTRERSKV